MAGGRTVGNRAGAQGTGRRADGAPGGATPSSLARVAAWHPAWLLLPVLVYKIALALTMAGHPLVQPVGDLDSGEYWRLAARVAAGDVLLDGTPFYVSPLYVYVLAVLQVVGGSVAGVLAGQALLGTAAVALVWRVVVRWSTRLAATMAAALVALTGVLALQEASLLQSALDPLLVALFLLALTCALQGDGTRWWAACGAALALFALNRPNALADRPRAARNATGLAAGSGKPISHATPAATGAAG